MDSIAGDSGGGAGKGAEAERGGLCRVPGKQDGDPRLLLPTCRRKVVKLVVTAGSES